jgi:N-acetylglucosaminyl-diphospho-decaprenol L-rhamnosyltransferase
MSDEDALPMSVVVVSFNTCDVLEPCLQSIVASGAEEIVVVDNGSTDGSIDLVRTRFSSARLIVNQVNHGYGAAANQGIAICESPAVLLLNSDTTVAADGPTALGRYLASNPDVAVAGPRLVNLDGSLQRSTYPLPSVADTLLGETGLHLLVRRVPVLLERSLRTWSYDVARRVPWVLGAALAIRRTAFDAVGGFDEGFFMYGEEMDLCRRLAAAGLATHYAPVTTVVHAGGSSTRTREGAMRRELLVSKRRYLLRHEPEATAGRILAADRCIIRARLIRDAVRLRLTRNPDRQSSLRADAKAWRALLAEKSLWKP